MNNTDTRMFDGIARKGEIWNIEQGNTASTGTEIWSNRPAIIVSNEATNQKAGFVNVVYLTTSHKKEMPYHVSVMSGDKQAIALCEQIFAVDKSRITFYIGKITPQELLEVDKALLFSLGISNSLKPTALFTKWLNAIQRYNIDLSNNPLYAKSNDCDDSSLIKELNKYKVLYEQNQKTIERLMMIS